MTTFQNVISDLYKIENTFFPDLGKDVLNIVSNIITMNDKYEKRKAQKKKGFVMNDSSENEKKKIFLWNQRKCVVSSDYSNIKIIQIVSGCEHIIFLDDKGIFYSRGNNYDGQLGIHKDVEMCNDLYQMTIENVEFQEIIAGGFHNFAIGRNKKTNKIKTYCWGSNQYGQLGIGNETDKYIPTVCKLETKNQNSQIKCGCHFSILLNKNGEIYSCGNNELGQLGFNVDVVNASRFRKIKVCEEFEFQEVITGAFHSFGIGRNRKTCEKKIFCWGSNKYSQLGTTSDKIVYSPIILNIQDIKIKEYDYIRDIQCGTYHTILITNDGRCFGAGSNMNNQLVLGKNILTSNNRFCEIQIDGFKFHEVIVGGTHNFAIMQNEKTGQKETYFWGQNDIGSFGIDHDLSLYSLTKFKIDKKKCHQIILSSCSDFILGFFSEND